MARSIKVAGETYTWQVGKKNLVIRSSGKTAKKLIQALSVVEQHKTEYCVVTWDWNYCGYRVASLCSSKEEAEAEVEFEKKYSQKPALLFERQVTVAITPATIRSIIEKEF